MKNLITLVISITLLGCASKPVIDTKGVDIEAYQKDLAECKQIVEQVESTQAIAKSAAFGALVTGSMVAIAGGDWQKSATIGATQGAATGALKQDNEEFTVLKNCLTNRGYTVLN